MHRFKNSRQILNLGRRAAARWPEQHNPGGPHLSGKAHYLKMVASQNKRFGTYPAPAARDHGVPGVVVAVGGVAQKLPVIPLAENILPALWSGKKALPSYTESHKEARWAEYQRDHINDPKAYAQTRWDNSYETTRNNNIFGLGREREYAVAMGAESRVLKTAFTFRQIDIFIERTGYCGQLKTGPLYLREQEKINLQKDSDLVAKGFEVEYILEKGASKPMVAAIKAAGGTYKIGPQIS